MLTHHKSVRMTVDPDDVMNIGNDLVDRYPDAFSGNFEENKRQIERLTEVRSRHVRNRVAGYITRQCSGET
ncbi:MAG: small subunit ribosomal protein S17e [Natronomonas sp.]|jgi:small subunit ribosomal protein S17e